MVWILAIEITARMTKLRGVLIDRPLCDRWAWRPSELITLHQLAVLRQRVCDLAENFPGPEEVVEQHWPMTGPMPPRRVRDAKGKRLGATLRERFHAA